MTLPSLATIKKRRSILGKTQKQLADLCGVSQSVIAKLESGAVDPAYSTAAKILETLERLESMETSGDRFLSLTAKDVMTQKIISLRPTDLISKAEKLLTNDSNISQLPVIDEHGKLVGSLTEAQVLFHSKEIEPRLVRGIMLEPFPIVSQKTNILTIRNILLGEPAVIVSDGKGSIAGIITKFDLIRAIRDGKR